MKDRLNAVKNHVSKHRAKYAAAATLAVTVAVFKSRGQLAEVLSDSADQIEATVAE